MTRLEGFLNEHSNTGDSGMGLADQTYGSRGCLSVGKKIVNDQYMVILTDKLGIKGQLVAGSLSKGSNLCLVQMIIEHLGGLLL